MIVALGTSWRLLTVHLSLLGSTFLVVGDPSLADLNKIGSSLTVGGLMLLIITALLRRWVVIAYYYDAKAAECDKWQGLYFASRETDEAAITLAQQLARPVTTTTTPRKVRRPTS